MAKDFKASQIRTTQIIVSGSMAGKPALMIVSASSHGVNYDGGGINDSTTLAGVGPDVFVFVSGSKGSKDNTTIQGVTVFGGDIVVSGTAYDGAGNTFGATSPGGSDTQIQFNDGGSTFGGSAGLTFNKSTHTLKVGNLTVTGSVTTVTSSNLVISDPVIYFGSGSKTSNSNGGIALTSGSATTNQALVFGRVANDTWGVGKQDVIAGTATDLTTMNLVPMRASSFQIGANIALTSSNGQDLLMYSAGGGNIKLSPGSLGLSLGNYISSVGVSGSDVRFGNVSTQFGDEIPPQPGVDSYFFVSGAIGSKGTSTKGTAVFGGDVVVSGTINAIGDLIFSGSSKIESVGLNTLVFRSNAIDIAKLDAGIFQFNHSQPLYFGGSTTISASLSNGTFGTEIASNILKIKGPYGTTSNDPYDTSDTFLFVSGSTNSKGTSIRGTTVFGGDVVVSGTINAIAGFSGSLTKLVDGTSYLIAGTNTTITTGVNGAVTIASTGGGDSFFSSTVAGQVHTTGSVVVDGDLIFSGSSKIESVGLNTLVFRSNAINIAKLDSGIFQFNNGQPLYFGGSTTISASLSNGAFGTEIASNILKIKGPYGTTSNDPYDTSDTFLFVSGSTNSKGTSIRGTTVFGGDVVVSGTINAIAGFSGSLTRLTNGTPYIVGGGSIGVTTGANGQITISYTDLDAVTGTFNVAGGSLITTASVSLAGTKGFVYSASSIGADAYFFVSGSKSSKGGASPTVSVFGGDAVVSGTFYVESGLISSASSGGVSLQTVGITQRKTMLDSINILSGWSGDAVYYGSTSVNYGRLYYLDPTGSWTRTHHATTPGQYMSSSILAIALGDGTASTVGMLTSGYVRLDLNTGIGAAGSVNSFSTGSIVYVSGSVVGGLMSTVKPNIATNVVRVIGYCTPYNQLLKFDPASYFAVV